VIERLGWLSLWLLMWWGASARAADVTGRWRVTIATSADTITGKASLKQTGDTVTGGWDQANTIQFQSMEFAEGTSLPLRRLLNPDGRWPLINAI
jgi:hypothetical protein